MVLLLAQLAPGNRTEHVICQRVRFSFNSFHDSFTVIVVFAFQIFICHQRNFCFPISCRVPSN